MKKIEFKTEGKYLYEGTFDLSDDNKSVFFYTNEKIIFNIQNAVGSFQNIESKLCLKDLIQICKDSYIKATIYPNGNVGFRKLDSSEDELKTCYISIVSTSITKYIICVAFDETQPGVYKGQLLSVFLFENSI